MKPTQPNRLVTAIGSAVISTLIVLALGRMYGLAPGVLIVLAAVTALLAGYAGYRSSERS